MKCPRCQQSMCESYDARTGKNQMYECDNCGFTQSKFDALASTEGYPADDDLFEQWRMKNGLSDEED